MSNDFSYPGKDLESMSLAYNYHHWILDILEPYVGQNILEVGAGRGNFSKLLLQRFERNTYLLEPSREMFPQINTNLEGVEGYYPDHCFNGFLQDHSSQLATKDIQSIFYVNVLEHIPDDQHELKIAYETLQVGGYILTFSPALPQLMSDFDRSIGHFRRYYLSEMKSKMEKAGFRVVKAHYMDLLGVIPWYIVFTLLKKNLSGGNVDTYDKLVIPWLRHIEPHRWLPFGKNILVVGQKVSNK